MHYSLAKALTVLAAVAFLMAVVTAFTGPIAPFDGVQPEGYSRACTNLALLAIAFLLAFRDRAPTSFP